MNSEIEGWVKEIFKISHFLSGEDGDVQQIAAAKLRMLAQDMESYSGRHQGQKTSEEIRERLTDLRKTLTLSNRHISIDRTLIQGNINALEWVLREGQQ